MNPTYEPLPAGTIIHRIYDPSRFRATATRFRYEGPFVRFDHHVEGYSDRGVLYGADDFEGCLVEVFGDIRELAYVGKRRHCRLEVTRDLKMLDLRGNGALNAGTTARISKGEHALSQRWSRYFYETSIYGLTDGIVYLNAHNDQTAYAFYERCDGAFRLVEDNALSDDHPEYTQTALKCNLDIAFEEAPTEVELADGADDIDLGEIPVE